MGTDTEQLFVSFLLFCFCGLIRFPVWTPFCCPVLENISHTAQSLFLTLDLDLKKTTLIEIVFSDRKYAVLHTRSNLEPEKAQCYWPRSALHSKRILILG